MLLALDLGTNCGWATNSDPLAYGVVRLPSHDGRYLQFQKWLKTKLHNIDRVYYEDVRRHLGTQAAHCYGGLAGILKTECLLRCIPYHGVPVGTLKKAATNNGAATKEQMVEAAVRRFKVVVSSHDEADALHLLNYGLKADLKAAKE